MKKIISNICNFLKKYKEYFLSFLLGFFLILVIFLLQGMYFQDKSMLLSDSFVQYYELFYYLKEVLCGAKSIFYTFQLGGGTGMIATLAYYLISPFNLLVAIFDFNHLQMAMHLIIMLKIAASLLTMFILLRSEHKKTNYWVLFAFAACYSLSDYFIAYEFDFIWFDALYLLPLVILGINKIVDNKKPILYFITLFLTIMCNYYMGYMVCLFSLLYFIYRLNIKYNYKKDKNEMLKATSTYIFTTLFAGLATFFLMFPTLMAMKEMGRSTISNAVTTSFFGPEMISKMFFGIQDSAVLNKDNALLYCGLINFVLLIMYFFNKKIDKKEQVWSLALLSFLILSLFFKPLYYMWHVFSTPSSFAARFSYFIIFFTILLAVKEFDNIKTSELKEYLISAILITLIALYFIINPIDYLNYGAIYGTVIGCYFYLFLLYQYKVYEDDKSLSALRKMFVFLIIGELFFNAYIVLNAINKNSYLQVNEYANILNKAYNQIDDKSDYRIADLNDTSMLSSLLSNKNGVSIFLSTSSSNILGFTNKLGYNGYSNAYKYQNNATELTDVLLNTKYIFSNADNYKNYDNIGSYQYSIADGLFYNVGYTNYYLLRNNSTFGIATLSTSKKVSSTYSNQLQYQNLIFRTLTGIESDIYNDVKLSYTNSENVYTFVVPNTKYFYLYFPRVTADNNSSLYINNKLVIKRDKDTQNDEVLYLKNNYSVGSTASIKIESDINRPYLKPALYTFDDDAFQSGVSIMQSHQLTNVLLKDNGYLKGTINASDNFGVLYISIPYENGWTAYVDGVKTDISKIYNGMMSISLSKGKHTIELKYQTPGLIAGMIISLISIGLYLAYYFHKENVDNLFCKIIIKFYNFIKAFLSKTMFIIVSLIAYIIFNSVVNLPAMSCVTIAWIFAIAYKYVVSSKEKSHDFDSILKDILLCMRGDLINYIIELLIMFYLTSHYNEFFLIYLITLVSTNIVVYLLKKMISL